MKIILIQKRRYIMTFRDTLPTGKALNQDDQVVSNSGRYQLILQRDGNFVLYDLSAGQKALWSSGTAGHPNSCLRVQDDGNLAIYQPSDPIWATNTVQS